MTDETFDSFTSSTSTLTSSNNSASITPTWISSSSEFSTVSATTTATVVEVPLFDGEKKEKKERKEKKEKKKNKSLRLPRKKSNPDPVEPLDEEKLESEKRIELVQRMKKQRSLSAGNGTLRKLIEAANEAKKEEELLEQKKTRLIKDDISITGSEGKDETEEMKTSSEDRISSRSSADTIEEEKEKKMKKAKKSKKDSENDDASSEKKEKKRKKEKKLKDPEPEVRTLQRSSSTRMKRNHLSNVDRAEQKAKHGSFDEDDAAMNMSVRSDDNIYGEDRKLKQKQSSKKIEDGRSNSVAGLLFSVKQLSPHKFVKFPSGITVNLWCEYCKGFIFSVSNQEAYCCEKCNYPAHRRCIDYAGETCGKPMVLEDTSSHTKLRSFSSIVRRLHLNEPELSLVIADASTKFCAMLYEHLYQVPFVYVHNGSILDCKRPLDTIMVCGNAFGVREPDSYAFITVRNLFGEKFIHRIREYIVNNYLGEMPLYSAFILETESDHPIRHLVYVSGSYSSPCSDAYATLWAALTEIKRHNRNPNNSAINNICCVGFGLKDDTEKPWLPDIGTVSAKKLSKETKQQSFFSVQEDPYRTYYIQTAFQLRTAWYNYIMPPIEMDWQTATHKESILKVLPTMYEHRWDDERKEIFTQLLSRGDIEHRGFIERLELRALMAMAKSDQTETDIQKAAVRTITVYSYPEEFRAGIRASIQKEGIFDKIMHYACLGESPIHREIAKSEITFGEKIADGATASVFKGVWKGRSVAIKVIKENTKFTIENLRRELSILSIIEHENLLICNGGSAEDRIIVTELMDRGSLYDFLRTSPSQDLAQQIAMMIDIAKGMVYLHSLNFIHRDLKSCNVLLGPGNRLKISDFGSSRVNDPDHKMTSTLGTLSWIPPEIFNDEKYSQSADVYSFGILMWEILSQQIPYDGKPLTSIPVAVVKGERPPIPSSCPKKLAQLIAKCWNAKQNKRPTFQEALDELTKMHKALTEDE